jgi:AmiR/NasT family two-component response regulator
MVPLVVCIKKGPSLGTGTLDGMSKARIVIAEDEGIVRLDLKETLEEEGYEVVGETARGDEVIQLVEQTKPDVAILDVKLPGEDGISVARKLGERRDVAVLMLTAFSQRDVVREAIEAGALGYLVKPFQRSELAPAIEVALARHRDMKALEQEREGLEEALETRKLVERAKGKLMDEHDLAESEAYRLIQKSAMERRLTMRRVAELILDGSIDPHSSDIGGS